MPVRNHSDQGFDDYRKARKRMQAKLGPQNPVLGYENQALRELEQVEEREVRDQKLTREVHEFFATATRQAASIVDRVAKDAEAEAGARVEQEMEAFLIDALSRMNSFIVTVLQQRRGAVAETQMEPKVANIVGPSLDEFRFAGTAETGDKHIGQDPFATDLEEVRRELRAASGPDGESAADATPIEDHLVAAVADEESTDDEADAAPPAPAPKAQSQAHAPRAAAPAPAAAAAATAEASPQAELETFKGALKALVRQGVMSRDEARAAWQQRLQSLGLKG